MWSSSRAFAAVLLTLSLAGATALAGCSGFRPVYGEAGIGAERLAFNYAKPASRLDQVVYEELALRLGRATGPEAPTVRVATSSSVRKLTRSAVARPSEQREAVVNARIELVSPEGKLLYSASRSATALYTADSNQALAAGEAEIEALERAARELAETVRLTLLGALATRPAA